MLSALFKIAELISFGSLSLSENEPRCCKKGCCFALLVKYFYLLLVNCCQIIFSNSLKTDEREYVWTKIMSDWENWRYGHVNMTTIFYSLPSIRVHISGVIKCVTNVLTLSQWGDFDSVKNFVTHFVTPEIWILIPIPLKLQEKLISFGCPYLWKRAKMLQKCCFALLVKCFYSYLPTLFSNLLWTDERQYVPMLWTEDRKS